MKRIQCGIIPLLICLLFTACKDDEMVSRVVEGLPVSLNMKMLVPGPSDVQTNTRASDEVETNVEKLALLFYKYENSTPCVVEIPTDNLNKTQEGSSTNYFYSFTVTAEQMTQAGIMSGEYWVYAIANWDKGFCKVDLNEVKQMDKAQLEEYCVLKTNNLIDLNETALLLTGKYEGPNGEEKVTLQPGDNKFSNFHLKRITAKIIFNFENGTDANFVPTEYELHNYSRSSTLIERTGWTGKEGTAPGKLVYKGREDAGAFNSTGNKAIQLPPKGNKDHNFYFYMLENVQTAKGEIKQYTDREKGDSRLTENRKFTNAPDRGTYVVVKGTYSGKRGGTDPSNQGDKVTGTVAYTIHLGDFSQTGSFDNFTVRRNAKYKYNITVNGVNSIIVEATTNVEGQSGAEGDIMKSTENVYNLDAHFETVMLTLSKNPIKDYSFLAITPYGKRNIHTQDGDHVKPEDEPYISWVKFGAPASPTAFKPYPGDDSPQLVNLYELVNKINDYIENPASVPENVRPFIEVGDKIYVTAYVDEFYYDNEKDLSKFVNVDDRRLAMSHRTSQSADGGSTYTESPIFAINQKSIQSVFALDGSVAPEPPFGAETIEETADAVLSEKGAGVEPSTFAAPRPNWGWRNLWEQLHGYNIQDHEHVLWETFVNAAQNGHFKSNAEQSDALQIKALQSKYDYALYQCFARNRDENGDGNIDVEEMKWYLPAIDECMAFWYGASALSDEVKFNNTQLYFTSTNGSFRSWWVMEGNATGIYKGNDAPGGKQRVRCIRTLGQFGKSDNEFSAPIVKYNKQDRIIQMDNMGANTLRTSGSQMGEYNPHDLLGTENKLPEAFQFAEKDLSYSQSSFPWSSKSIFTYNEVLNGNVCQRYYSEKADGSDLGQWRIPNQRELALIHRYYRDGTVTESSNLSDYTAARTYYQRTEGKALYFVQTGTPDFITTTWFPNNSTSQDRFSSFKIRCVRDVTPRSNP